MNKLLLLFFCSLNLMLTAQETPHYELKDIYGRVIRTIDHQLINYPKAGNLSAAKALKNTKEAALPPTVNAEALWSYLTMGTHIGQNSMNTLDIDDDGVPEIICSAQYDHQVYRWYVLKYNKATSDYTMVWNSPAYHQPISTITLADLDNDARDEILVISGSQLEVYKSAGMQLINSLELNAAIISCGVGDADNDGRDEVLVLTGENILLLHPNSLETIYMIEDKATAMAIGNVDEDAAQEIVLNSGRVLELHNDILKEEWRFHSHAVEGLLALSDIDGDKIEEVVYAEAWFKIKVLDVDTKSTQYTISTRQDIHALLLFDTNADGMDEIIYGDAQWGYLNCIDAVTQKKLWRLRNPDHGITAIKAADVNGDGNNELLWGSGWTSSDADHLYIANIKTRVIEWKSKHLDGPFYAVEIGDVDNDGVDEMVAISHKSNSSYGSGIISVLNADTYAIEWQSDATYLDNVWEGVHTLQLEDVDKDGVLEIIVAADQSYTGQIWIIDGKTKAIEQSKIYTDEGIGAFSALAIGDVDGDGQPELITAGAQQVCIINAVDLEVQWKSPQVGQATYARNILLADVDADDVMEIITCMGQVIVIDGKSKDIQTSDDTHYTDFDLSVPDENGHTEIVAVSNKGNVEVLNVRLEANRIFSLYGRIIDAIHATDLNSDGVDEFILSTNGQLVFATAKGKYEVTTPLAGIVGEYDGLKRYDFTGDGKDELIVGTSDQLMVLPADIYRCTWFTSDVISDGPDCGAQNGYIELQPEGGMSPYEVMINDKAADLIQTGLKYGEYHLRLEDAQGCVFTADAELARPALSFEVVTRPVACNTVQSGEAWVQIQEGTAPYEYRWSTGDNGARLINQSHGHYEVTIVDAKQCTQSKTLTIEKEALELSVQVDHLTCHGAQSGAIHTSIDRGTAPLSYRWSNGASTSTLQHISGGNYTLLATDAHGCVHEQSIDVMEPDALQIEYITSPDDPSTAFGEGTAEVVAIQGGVAPYHIRWNDPLQQKGADATHLLEGAYKVFIEDSVHCVHEEIITIVVNSGIKKLFANGLEIYPNPARDQVRIENPVEQSVQYKVYGLNGSLYKSGTLLPNGLSHTLLDISSFTPGSYIIQILTDEGVFSRRLVIGP
ncbi:MULTISPECIES: FG-GAP-like repeat-containing protein [unclassified Carboxylicivirga]|uniref:FG-GAP-like repeat-containing protein n=1 Tax=Carboxylicivirga TaxID=1628153 RepID=UPI003D352A5F